MSTKWKPGTVAMLSGLDGEEVMAFRQGRQWATQSHLYLNDWQVTARPLVVIDPEDREAVERFWAIFAGINTHGLGLTGALQAALREFANPTPPKPEEPLGLGAVVEDVCGSTLTRISMMGGLDWINMHGIKFRWSDIDAPTVLSPGYTGYES